MTEALLCNMYAGDVLDVNRTALESKALNPYKVHVMQKLGLDILLVAMDADDAKRARSLFDRVTFYRVNSSHGFHFEKPHDFARIVLVFKDPLYV